MIFCRNELINKKYKPSYGRFKELEDKNIIRVFIEENNLEINLMVR
jgi:hypothetical protein